MANTVTPDRLSRAGVEVQPARRLNRPRWTDRKVLIGIVLVVVSVLGVARFVAAADHTVSAWTVTSDLGSGVTLTADDVKLTAVQLGNQQAYLPATSSPVGWVTTRAFGSGELVAKSGVVMASAAPPLRWVTLPVERHHMPSDLQRGEVVDVYLVERTAGGEPVGDPTLVLKSATVAEVDSGDSRFGGNSLELGISLSVPLEDVAPLVGAEARGTLTLVRVPVDGG